MNKTIAWLGLTTLLAACAGGNDAAEDKVEREAAASARSAGAAVAALGLTEAQLLDADLRGPGGIELGDITQVLHGQDGKVDRLLVEIEDSKPDRYVHVPLAGLTTVARGAETDLATALTREQLMALPEIKLTSP